LTTLDEVDRSLDDFTVLVADTSGALSLAGVMGGAESEVSEGTVNVLLEGAAWNYINIRRTVSAQKLSSDAAYRFERGVHPAMAERGVRGCLAIMARLAGGKVAEGLVDAYPLPPEDPTVEVKPVDVERLLGVHLGVEEIAEILRRLTFEVEVKDGVVRATAPDYRLDIGLGVIGVADVIEEIARVYGYDRIPETQIADTIPPQYGNPNLEREERVRDLLVYLGLQEVVTYRITSPEREKRIHPPEAEPEDQPYIQIANPIASDRIVMRRSLLASLLEIVERNARIRERISIFEIGPVYLVTEEDGLPDEPRWLAIVLTGQRSAPTWREVDLTPIDFYDLKGLMDELFAGLQIENIRYQPKEHPSFHPGKSAEILFQDHAIGIMGELHPSVRENYDLPEAAIVAGEFDLEMILDAISEGYTVHPVPVFPPVLEDLAIVVDEGISAEEVEAQIREAAGSLLIGLRLFDLYRGEQIAEGKKSLAYSLTYQASDRTLTDEEVAKIRAKVIARLGSALGAKLRD
jgi:phenylalanyl-tRNA synthetase beta chain